MRIVAATVALAVAFSPALAAAQEKKPGSRTGEEIYTATCAACHKEGVANAPRVGDRKRWSPLIKEGLKELTADAIKGKAAMPPKGGDSTLTRLEVSRAIVFMANRSGAKWQEPR
jgi:cytochrome c5